jgi:hypothetical protein
MFLGLVTRCGDLLKNLPFLENNGTLELRFLSKKYIMCVVNKTNLKKIVENCDYNIGPGLYVPKPFLS